MHARTDTHARFSHTREDTIVDRVKCHLVFIEIFYERGSSSRSRATVPETANPSSTQPQPQLTLAVHVP